MSTVPSLIDRSLPNQNESLSDIVDKYGSSEGLPAADWLTRLNLKKQRQDTVCLGERTRLLKRLTDIIISSICLVILSPVFLLVALAVKFTSRGPIIFKQVRVGLNLRRNSNDRRQDGANFSGEDRRHQENNRRNNEEPYGKHFVLYKFRTMTTDAEKNGAQFAVKNDPRVTSIGRFLRKTRLDELPQLWNVLKGEMSLVGPRPERPEFIEGLSQEIPSYINRLGLKPGLTGVAQIVNGYDNDIEGFRRKVFWDLTYLQHCCFWNDLKILVRTIKVICTGSGAL